MICTRVANYRFTPLHISFLPFFLPTRSLSRACTACIQQHMRMQYTRFTISSFHFFVLNIYICIYVFRLHLSLRLKVSPVLTFTLSLSLSLFHLAFSLSRARILSFSLFLSGSASLTDCAHIHVQLNIYDVAVVENIHDWLLLQLYSLFRVQLFRYTNDFFSTWRLRCDVSSFLHVCVCLFPLLLHYVCEVYW